MPDINWLVRPLPGIFTGGQTFIRHMLLILRCDPGD